MKYRLIIPPSVEETIAQLPPNLKRKIRSALETIREDPHLGKSLKDELRGLRSYQVSRYRIVYRIHHGRIEVQVIDIGPRNLIYERILEAIKEQKSQ